MIIEYVGNYLSTHGGEDENYPFRKRIDHIKRVFMWANRLMNDPDIDVNKDAVLIAALFHDVGCTASWRGEGHDEQDVALKRLQKLAIRVYVLSALASL